MELESKVFEGFKALCRLAREMNALGKSLERILEDYKGTTVKSFEAAGEDYVTDAESDWFTQVLVQPYQAKQQGRGKDRYLTAFLSLGTDDAAALVKATPLLHVTFGTLASSSASTRRETSKHFSWPFIDGFMPGRLKLHDGFLWEWADATQTDQRWLFRNFGFSYRLFSLNDERALTSRILLPLTEILDNQPPTSAFAQVLADAQSGLLRFEQTAETFRLAEAA